MDSVAIFCAYVTCYNVTMQKQDYYNEFFELGQQKINFSQDKSLKKLQIRNDHVDGPV